MKKVFMYDTTLRDGSQTEGISYSVNDKVNIVKRLDDFGMHFIEGGWPFSNPKDQELFDYFKKKKLKKSKLVPFGSTAHPKAAASKDKNLISLVKADTEYVTIFGKSWDLHVKSVLKISLDANLNIIHDSVSFLKKKGKKVFFDAEHFFDGFKQNEQYAVKALKAALTAGAELAVLCDTNGGTLTSEVVEIVKKLSNEYEIKDFGMHCHNDMGLAVANSVIAVNYGCSHIQGTINGYGERCGNADLIQIMAILQSKHKANVVGKKIAELTELSHYVSEISNMAHKDNHPFVGRSAFAHKAGVHVDAMIKNSLAYEHMDPAQIGNKRRFLVSELAGKATLVAHAKELEYDLDKKSPKAKKLYKLVQDLEKQGYQFEVAQGSFKLLMEKEFKKAYRKFFDMLTYRVIIEQRDDKTLMSEATVKLKVKGKLEHTASEGDGPVNALDSALRKALCVYYPILKEMHLVDFKVRVLDEKFGTAAKVRVLIESQDQKETWKTVGVSENIIEASYNALVDSIEYKLLKEKKNKRL